MQQELRPTTPTCFPHSTTCSQAVDRRLLATDSRWFERTRVWQTAKNFGDRFQISGRQARRKWRKKGIWRDNSLEDQRSSGLKWSKFESSHYFAPSAQFLLLKSISWTLPNWNDCDGKSSNMFITGGGCRLPLMHIKHNRWCYALNSNCNRACVKYPFQSSAALP